MLRFEYKLKKGVVTVEYIRTTQTRYLRTAVQNTDDSYRTTTHVRSASNGDCRIAADTGARR